MARLNNCAKSLPLLIPGGVFPVGIRCSVVGRRTRAGYHWSFISISRSGGELFCSPQCPPAALPV